MLVEARLIAMFWTKNSPLYRWAFVKGGVLIAALPSANVSVTLMSASYQITGKKGPLKWAANAIIQV